MEEVVQEVVDIMVVKTTATLHPILITIHKTKARMVRRHMVMVEEAGLDMVLMGMFGKAILMF